MDAIHVASAFISGVYPILMLEKMKRGKVVIPGPDVKLAKMTSSKEIIKAIIQLDVKEGINNGTMTSANVCSRDAPKSIAASDIFLSMDNS